MNDYISREAAKQVLDWHLAGDAAGIACKLMDSLPAADVESVRRWTACSERLPEKDGSYLVADACLGWIAICRFDKEKKFPGARRPKKDFWWRLSSEWGMQRMDGITHWMPLPEIPKEKTDDGKA